MELPKQDNQVFVSSATPFESRPMKIQTAAGMAKGLAIMRSGIYSDKIGAVVREYICNAIDEHKKYCPLTPIQVFVDEEGFRVRDFGKGLDKETVFNVFGAFFESTKQKGDIGGFGLGSKSGHAYADIFHIYSFFGGKQQNFSFILGTENGYESATSNKTGETDSTEPTGLEVIVPILNAFDQREFLKKVTEFARYCDFPIEINGKAAEQDVPVYTNGKLKLFKSGDRYEDSCFVRMGGVMYRSKDRPRNIGNGYKVVIDMEINSVDIPPSREQISYTENTKTNLTAAVQQIDADIQKEVESLQYQPSPVDIFNILVSGNLPQNIGHAWFERSLVSRVIKARYANLAPQLLAINFDGGANQLYAYNDYRNRGYRSHRPALNSQSKIVILKDNVGVGESKYKVLKAEVKSDHLLFIKNTSFDLAKIPVEIKDLFVDFRTFKFPTNRVPATRPPKEHIYANALGSYNGRTEDDWKKFVKEKNIQFYVDHGTPVAHLVGDSALVVQVRSKKAKDLFSKLLPDAEAWAKKNQKDLEEEAQNVFDANYTARLSYVLSGIVSIPKAKGGIYQSMYRFYQDKLKLAEPKFSTETEKLKKWLDSQCVLAYVCQRGGSLPAWLEKQVKDKAKEIIK